MQTPKSLRHWYRNPEGQENLAEGALMPSFALKLRSNQWYWWGSRPGGSWEAIFPKSPREYCQARLFWEDRV